MPKGTTPNGHDESYTEQNREAQRRNQAGAALRYIERRGYNASVDGVTVLDIRIKVADVGGGTHLAVLRAYDGEGQPVVAFHSSEDILGCLSGLYVKLSEGNVKWKPDAYRQ